MNHLEITRKIIREAKRYCAKLLKEGARTWAVPDEYLDCEDSEWASERWRIEIEHIADKLERHAKGAKKNDSY